MRLLKDLIVIIILSFIISLVVYLSLLPSDKKPPTFNEFKLKDFLNN